MLNVEAGTVLSFEPALKAAPGSVATPGCGTLARGWDKSLRIALMITGPLRGFGRAFRTWDWMMRQVTDTYFLCPPPVHGETPIESMIPGAVGKYLQQDEPHSWHTCFNDLAAYDLVIRCRPDNMFFSQVCFTHPPERLGIWIPNYFSWGGVTDRFAAGTMAAMRKYCDFCFVSSRDGVEANDNPEKKLWYYLQASGVAVHRFDLVFCQMEADGSLRNEHPQDRGLIDPHGMPLADPLVKAPSADDLYKVLRSPLTFEP